MGGTPKICGTPKWMVKIMENPMNKWMIWGENPLFSETSTVNSVLEEIYYFRRDFKKINSRGL